MVTSRNLFVGCLQGESQCRWIKSWSLWEIFSSFLLKTQGHVTVTLQRRRPLLTFWQLHPSGTSAYFCSPSVYGLRCLPQRASWRASRGQVKTEDNCPRWTPYDVTQLTVRAGSSRPQLTLTPGTLAILMKIMRIVPGKLPLQQLLCSYPTKGSATLPAEISHPKRSRSNDFAKNTEKVSGWRGGLTQNLSRIDPSELGEELKRSQLFAWTPNYKY